MKLSDLTAAKGTILTPDEGTLFTVTVTFSDQLEVDFEKVTEITKLNEGGYWLKQQDGTLNDVPASFLYAALNQVPEE